MARYSLTSYKGLLCCYSAIIQRLSEIIGGGGGGGGTWPPLVSITESDLVNMATALYIVSFSSKQKAYV